MCLAPPDTKSACTAFNKLVKLPSVANVEDQHKLEISAEMRNILSCAGTSSLASAYGANSGPFLLGWQL